MPTATTPAPEELARLAHAQIKNHPRSHNQDRWGHVKFRDFKLPGLTRGRGRPARYIPAPELSCGSTACAAGWVGQFAGDKFVVDSKRYAGGTFVLGSNSYPSDHQINVDYVRTSTGHIMKVGSRARSLLKLSQEQADWLFHGHRPRKQVLKGLKAISQGDYDKLDRLVAKHTETEFA